jgi:type III restriction enzyme
VLIDDGHGPQDPLRLIVEIKGLRQGKEETKEKAETVSTYWVPGVNNSRGFGRWEFLQLTNVFEIQTEFAQYLAERTALTA